MKKKNLILIPALFIVTLVTLAACNNYHNPENKAEYIVHKISSHLNLREDQITKLNDVKDEIMQHQQEHKANKINFMDNLIVEIQKPSIDREFFSNIIEQHKTNLEQIIPPIVDKIVLFHESLTSEQKEDVVSMLEKFKNHH